MTEKEFRDTRTQIGILKGRGLIIGNKAEAKIFLREVGYYNLINGYKDLFIDRNTKYERYLKGTTFTELKALYEFDRKLRLLTIEYILIFEKHVKSLVGYTFSREHGHKNYLSNQNFDNSSNRNYKNTAALLVTLYKKLADNVDKEDSITHYVNHKNYVPFWVLANSLSMGEISKFYSNMKVNERIEVARRLNHSMLENELKNILLFLSSIRNRCAHDERLYSYSSYVKLKYNKYYKYFKCDIRSGSNYFSVMVALKEVLTENQYKSYMNSLDCLIEELDSKLNTISIKTVQSKMGMPNNWKKMSSLRR